MKINLGRFFRKNGGLLLSIAASGGVIITAIFSSKAAPKAKELLKEAEEAKGEPLTKPEMVKTVAKTYIPTVVSGAATITCIIGGSILDRKRQAALIGAYAVLAESYKKYKNKVIEEYGQETHNHIVESIAADQAKPQNVAKSIGLCHNHSIDAEIEEETRLFYDVWSGTYFESTYGKVLQAQYYVNRNMINDGWNYVPVAMWYEALGIEDLVKEKSKLSCDVGWMVNDYYQWIDFDNRVVHMADGLECIYIEFVWDPLEYEALEDIYT